MAEQISVPVVGKVKPAYVYGGVALLVGVVGYAWITRTRSAGPIVADDAASTALPDGTPPTVIDSNLSVANPAVVATNGEWTQKATEYLVGLGFDAQFAGSALGKYLGRLPLTSQEQDLVLSAVAAFDQPPVGRPYTVKSSPVPVNPPAPAHADWVAHAHRIERNYLTHNMPRKARGAADAASVMRNDWPLSANRTAVTAVVNNFKKHRMPDESAGAAAVLAIIK